jgi:hypothetical protein
MIKGHATSMLHAKYGGWRDSLGGKKRDGRKSSLFNIRYRTIDIGQIIGIYVSASILLVGFWWIDDNAYKELMMFHEHFNYIILMWKVQKETWDPLISYSIERYSNTFQSERSSVYFKFIWTSLEYRMSYH